MFRLRGMKGGWVRKTYTMVGNKYKNYLTLAKHYFKQGNLKTARELLQEAKKIKITADLKRLENLINEQQ